MSNELSVLLSGLIRPIIAEEIDRQLNEFKKAIQPSKEEPIPQEFLNVSEAAELLGIASQTLYTNIGKIPHLKRHGRLYFKRTELIDYLESGRVKGSNK